MNLLNKDFNICVTLCQIKISLYYLHFYGGGNNLGDIKNSVIILHATFDLNIENYLKNYLYCE